MPPSWSVAARCAVAGLLLCSLLAAADTPPDAGLLLERSREPLALPPLQAPRIELPAREATTTPAALLIPVRRLRIEGATVVPAARLHALVADAEGHELSLASLQALAARITRDYAGQGYLLARAYVPAQEIRDGEVVIAVLEGRLERVDSDDCAGLSPSLRRQLNAALPVGQPLRRDRLERVVLLNDALPGIAAAARLRPGDTPGATVVVVETRADERWRGALTVDNHGDRYTGRTQGGLRLEWSNPSGRGDQLALRLQSAGDGRHLGRLAYDLPVYGPLRATLAAASTRYALGEEFRRLDADGRAGTASLDLSYPLVLRPALRVAAQGGLEHMHLVDRIGLTATGGDKTLLAGRVGVTVQAADHWNGQSALQLQLTSGRLDIHDRDEQRFDAVSVGSEGGFSKLGLVAERLQSLPLGLMLRGSATLQWAFNNLASVQKLAIGGADAVRAWPAGEAQGDDGRLLALELQRAWPGQPRVDLVVFADHGRVRFNHEAWPGFAGDTHRELAAAGLGLNWRGPYGLLVTARQAWPLTEAHSTTGADDNARIWASAQLPF